MISIKNVEKLLAAKSREADERVASSHVTCVTADDHILLLSELEVKIRKELAEAVRLERERNNYLILKGLKLLDPKFENVLLRQVFDRVRSEILNPESPEQNN